MWFPAYLACDLQSVHTGPDVLPLVQPQSDVSFLDSTIKLSRIKKSKENQTICVESPTIFVLQPHFKKNVFLHFVFIYILLYLTIKATDRERE